ncbi:DUF3558 domain-containing protein [Amycolatopsis alba]|uniref:DUF3558 domain-containing protein n=1 Tax=Amycolatopsis alba DSM 44262 TaxID=1125972 RepID=A0A229RWF5_AMYAL|nr:DUF3558 domain-containing protein [Amycolatopsis alba]OXM50986.1 DUF3558 domain-containing protein [Amycolatopsis alba DSM 44262]
MRFRLVTTVIATTALLASCSTETGGTPAPASPSPNATELPRAGAPKVVTPLKTTAFETNACDAASEAEINSTGVTLKTVEPQEIAGGKGCLWIFTNTSGTMTGNLNASQPDGLSHLYALKAQGSGVTTFQPVADIAGYPAVVYANGGEGPGVCNLAIGVRDDMMYVLTTQLFSGSPKYDDACDLLTKIGEFAVQHFKAAQ